MGSCFRAEERARVQILLVAFMSVPDLKSKLPGYR